MRDNAFTSCPKEQCQMKSWGKGKVRRLLGGGAGLIFKGSGFYITDYRSEGYKNAAKKVSGGGDSGGGKTETAGAGASKESKSSSAGGSSESKTSGKTKGSKKD
jgi:predicted nucleic acid-binding Zn ribbon protein